MSDLSGYKMPIKIHLCTVEIQDNGVKIQLLKC